MSKAKTAALQQLSTVVSADFYTLKQAGATAPVLTALVKDGYASCHRIGKRKHWSITDAGRTEAAKPPNKKGDGYERA